MFTILSAKESDLNDARQWFEANGLSNDNLERILPFTMLLRVNDVLMGYICYGFLADDSCMVTDLFVDPAIRDQKFGDTLMRSLMNLLSRRGFDTLKANTNSPFVDFLKHFGFEATIDENLLILPSIDAFFNIPCKGNKC